MIAESHEIPIGYKLTDVGVIPNDWDSASIGSIATFQSGQGIRVATLACKSSHTPIPVFGGNGIAGYTDRALVQGPVVVVGRVGQKCGEAYFSRGPAWITDNALYPRCLAASVDARFLAQALRSAGLNDVKNRNDLPLVTQAILHSFKIPLPRALAEQEVIAEALGDADALIESLEQLVAKKRHLKQAAMQQLLTGKTRLPTFEGEWGLKQLGEIAETDPENLSSDTSPGYAFKYISLEDVDRGGLRGFSEHQFRTAPSRARRRLRKYDVLASTVRPNLLSHLWFDSQDDDWICSTGFCVIRCRDGVTSAGYIFQHLFGGFISRQINALLTGSNYPAINSGDVRSLEVPMPSFEEQRAISEVLTDMDDDIVALELKLSKARQIKQGMMQELLTGRTRLV